LPDFVNLAAPEKGGGIDVRTDLERLAGNNSSGACRKLFQFQKGFFGRRRGCTPPTLEAGKDCSLG
jgi:hypothetical protein